MANPGVTDARRIHWDQSGNVAVLCTGHGTAHRFFTQRLAAEGFPVHSLPDSRHNNAADNSSFLDLALSLVCRTHRIDDGTA